jgi:type IV pilus assembly protein PilY1
MKKLTGQYSKSVLNRAANMLAAFSLTASTAVTADDTDIYLNNSNKTYPPFLMLMIDYRPSTFNNLCGSVTGCAGAPLDADGDGVQDKDAENYPLYDDTGTLSGNAINKMMRLRCEAQKPSGCSDKSTGDGSYSDSVSTFQAFVAVLAAVVDDYDGLYVGLMSPNKEDGGVILRGYELFETGDANGAKSGLISVLNNIPEATKGKDAHKLQPKETFYELYRYLNGGAVINGTASGAAGNFTGVAGVPGPDTSIVSGSNYVSPFTSGTDFECSQLFGISMAMNVPNQDDSLDAYIDAIDGGKAGAVNASTNFETFLQYMSSDSADLVDDTILAGDQNMMNWIVSDSGSVGSTPDWAVAGGTGDGVIYLDDGVNMEAKLRELFTEVLSVSTTFVAASVPVNVFNRTEILDSFYVALFEAEASEKWPGNLKKLKLKDTDSDGIFDEIVDANDQAAFDTTDGRIRADRLTFWTSAADLPAPNVAEGEIAFKDGRAVARGGAGQMIPGYRSGAGSAANGIGTRQLFTEAAGATDINGDGFIDFNADAATAAVLQSDLGAADVATAQKLIMWSRGLDVDFTATVDLTLTTTRDWLLGDAIHSRPIAINYGARTGYSNTNPDIRLFMGSNDGFLRQFRNTDTVANGSGQSGEEVWGFIPRELLSNIQGLADNNGSSNPPNTDGSHPYGMDGEVVTLVIDQDKDGTIETGDKVYLYSGMRRGGRSYYALDVTDPDSPELMWSIDNTTTGFESLGLTFSTPVVTSVRYDGTDKNVLIFAGGYDTNKDNEIRDPDTMGNAIYVVDAVSGALIWSAVDGAGTNTDTVFYKSDLDHSIPAKVAPLDSNNNGVTDRLYVGDTSGIVWRVDLPEGTDPNHRRDNWTITKFADVDDAAVEEDRRFFHAAELVQTSDSKGEYDGVLIGTGDRASPLETTDENILLLFKDRNTVSGVPPTTILDDDQIADVTTCVTGTEAGCDTTSGALSPNSLQYGWKIVLREGEKALSKPLLAAGNVYFTTYSPKGLNNNCAPDEGEGFLYLVNLKDGTQAVNWKDFDDNGNEIDVRYQGVGPGIPAPATALTSDVVLIPGTGADVDGDGDKDKLALTEGKSRWIYYWRQKGQDQL